MAHELTVRLDVSHAEEQRLHDLWLSGPSCDLTAAVLAVLAASPTVLLDAVCELDELLQWPREVCACGVEVAAMEGARREGRWWHRTCDDAMRRHEHALRRVAS